MGYHFRSYIANDSEYFEYGDTNPLLERITGQALPITKTDLPLMESLIEFFYLDCEELEAICTKLSCALREYSPDSDFETFAGIRSRLEELSKKNIFFKLLELDWRDRVNQVDRNPESYQNNLPVEEIESIPAEVRERQQRLDEIFTDVLEFGSGKETIPERMALFTLERIQKDKANYPFHTLTIGCDAVTAAAFTDVLYPKSIYDLVDFYLRECIRREIPLRRCKNCGRWFALTGHQGWEYCTRVFDDKGRTCRDVGAINTWTAKRSEDEVFKVYRREYKKRFGWIKAGKILADDFYKWSEEARLQKIECDHGKISLDEFKEWLKKS